MITVERRRGAIEEAELSALSRLRIAVFRAYPYLYAGTLDYEKQYLAGFAASPEATLVIARDEREIVGASTAMPARDSGEADVIAPALERGGHDPRQVYYFGESVLLPAYRGKGIGHAFFDRREAAARELGYRLAAFCAVERPPNHPLRPADYRPLDAFWIARGYRKHPEMVAVFSWRDADEVEEREKRMVFWTKELA